MDFFDFSGTAPNTSLIEPTLAYSTVLSVPSKSVVSQGSTVVPAAGGPETKFTYSVIYNSTTTPTVHNLIIDPNTAGSRTIAMTATKVVNSKESLYQATTTDVAGAATYSFQFGAGTSTWQLPLNSVPFSGPQVAPFDISGSDRHAPTHTVPNSASRLPSAVIYTSDKGLTPTTADVEIDDQSYPMTAVSGKASTGIYYDYRTSSLAEGDHYLQFQFNDGSGLQTFQEYHVYVTPIVLNSSQVSPTSGTTSTQFTFSTVYFGPAAATAVDVVVDGAPHPLSLVSGTPATGATYSTDDDAGGRQPQLCVLRDRRDRPMGRSGGSRPPIAVSRFRAPPRQLPTAKIVGPPAQGYPYPYDAG